MQTIIKLTAWCLALLLFPGCTSVLYIDTTLQPEITITNDQWKVVAVNRFNPELLPFKREKKVDVFAEAATEAFYGVTEAIVQDETFNLIAVDTSGRYLQTIAGQPLTAEQVAELYAQNPHHLVMALESFDAFFEQETVSEKESDGSVNKTAHFTLHARTGWVLYDSTGTVLDRFSTTGSDLYNSRMVISGLLAVGPDMTKAGPALNKLAWFTGQDYWTRLHPKQVAFDRLYYTGKPLQQASMLMNDEKWEEAIALLTPIASGSNKKNAARAAYNLAIVYEAIGNIPESYKWATLSADKGNKLAKLQLHELARYKIQGTDLPSVNE